MRCVLSGGCLVCKYLRFNSLHGETCISDSPVPDDEGGGAPSENVPRCVSRPRERIGGAALAVMAL
jgi:hypothetical protein